MRETPLQRIIGWRTSVRRFDDRPITDEEVRTLAEAARLAPSAENSQPWRFIAVRDPEARAALGRASLSGLFRHSAFVARAPLVIALCADRTGAAAAAMAVKDRAMYQLDCGIAGEHIVLCAAEMGIGTCWIGWFNRRAAARSLGAPRGVRVVALIAAGYPTEGFTPRPRPRAPLSTLLWDDAWGRPFPGLEAQDGREKELTRSPSGSTLLSGLKGSRTRRPSVKK
jgi:nitroreductase